MIDMASEMKIAFWNVQNLFEPGTVARGPQSNDELDAKIGNLSKAINGFFNNQGTDLLGLAEIQSDAVFQRLVGQLKHGPYLSAWEPAGVTDQTGLGIVAREALFSNIQIVDVQRPSTFARPRVVIVRCDLKARQEPFLFIVNHWKSRLPSHPVSDEDQRRETADWLGQRLSQESKLSCAVVIGDFNAEPFEPAFGQLRLRAGRAFSSALWSSASPACLYNCAWKFLSEPDSWELASVPKYKEPRPKSSHGEGKPMLFDQLLVSGRVLRGGIITLLENSVEFPAVNQLTSRHKKSGKLVPAKWTYVSPSEFAGTSDHLPLVARFSVN